MIKWVFVVSFLLGTVVGCAHFRGQDNEKYMAPIDVQISRMDAEMLRVFELHARAKRVTKEVFSYEN